MSTGENGSRYLGAPASAAAAAGDSAPIVNALTIDVEDYYQVRAFETQISRRDWDRYPSRVEANTEAMLELFDAAQVHATFFVLGWIAERYPNLVRTIAARGHEIASHGYHHTSVSAQSPEAFRADVRRTRRLLEDISGTAVRGYRAANFSIGRQTAWAFAVLEEEVQECRQLNLRLAELTDVVQELLLPVAQRDEAKVAELMERYSKGL